MKLLGVSRRYQKTLIVCATVSLALGCATTRDGIKESGNFLSATTGDRSSDQFAMTGKMNWMDHEVDSVSDIFATEDGQIRIAYVHGKDFEHLVIDKAQLFGAFEVASLEDPSRLVIDFENAISLTPNAAALSAIKQAQASLISDIRLRKGGAGTQIIVEMAPGAGITSAVEDLDSAVIVSVQKDGSTLALAKQDVIRGVREQLASPSMAEGPEVVANVTADIEPLAEKEERIMLTSLAIDEQSGAGRVVAQLSESPVFKLKKTAPSEYTVRFFETDSLAASPVLATNPQGLIRAVRAVRDGGDTLLRIFAKPESTIRVVPQGAGKIVIAASGVLPIEEVRAQMDPDAVAPESETPPKAKDELSEEDFARFLGDQPKYTGRLISLDLQETDIDNALRIIAEVSNLNIIASEDVTGKVTLRLIDVPWDQALDVILKTNGLDKVQEGNVVRIAPVDRLRAEREALKQAKQAEEDLEELKVKFLRVSYAKAAELKPLVDGVISERGLVGYDERTNQLIVKDIERGLKNVVQLVTKLDLRTPQVLLETQIVEANRSLLRDLGSEFGFSYVQSPQTGNATGSNFPNSVQFGTAVSNPAAGLANSVSLLLGSADGTKSLTQVVTALESEGTVRIVSRPAVATTNNTPAIIKSIEKIRIRLPQGGVSVATGQGASAAGQGQTATETIDIGIVLTVTPQASPDYFVLMDIDAKSSTLGTNSVDGIPSEVERSARSSVLVSSGQTFALGGIYKTTDQTNLGGLPFFKDLPVFGHVFRRLNTENRDEELLFFLTPRIVEGSFDDASMKSTV
jgi:type IV pilus assembly protein PilQ